MKIYVGQVGLLIELDTLDDLAGATASAIKYRKPDKTTGEFVGVIDGTKVTYTTALATDIPDHGTWKLQAYAEGSGWEVLGETVDMEVFAAFE